jgi:CRISPR-associated protein Cas1
MSYHIVHIGSPSVRLTCRNGQFTCKTEEGEKSLPMEDIASVVITSFSADIHSEVFLQAAEKGVAFIYCRNFKPVSIVLPANRSTDTQLTRAVLNLSPRLRDQLWSKTVEAKCFNQYALAEFMLPDDEKLGAFLSKASSRSPNREAVCSRYFWRIFGEAMGETDFVRGRYAGGMNCFLNFGYAILLSLVLRNLYAVGLDPTFGIFHLPRERAAPLAYDLMEPFRPCVDARICEWVKDHPDHRGEVTAEFKKWMIPLVELKIRYEKHQLSVRAAIERSVRSFRSSVLSAKADLYKPWTLKNSKWAG